MLKIYRAIMGASAPLLVSVLEKRVRKGKEDSARLPERQGQASLPRPAGPLGWVHAASVGEAQSALILIRNLLQRYPRLSILVTTGTRTSAALMQKNLPARAFHQFYPLDHPQWTEHFLNHWRPDFVLWMESELWPNMLGQVHARRIPAALINARLSDKSYRLWRMIRSSVKSLLDTFEIILAQTPQDAHLFEALGARQVIVTDNLKYSAEALSYDEKSLGQLMATTQDRPLWVFASTHKGEEFMACRVHQILKNALPDLLTIIVPRHPERRQEIISLCEEHKLQARLRGTAHQSPDEKDDIYIADTLGELGLFYRLAPVTCIGRSFSDDGGGGHNPIEAAQLHCAVMHGPNVQNLQEIFDEMDNAGAALSLKDEKDLEQMLEKFLTDAQMAESYQVKAYSFAKNKGAVVERVTSALDTMITRAVEVSGDKQCA